MNRRVKLPALLTHSAEYAALLGVLGLLIGTFGILTDHFFTASTVRLIANQIPSLTVVAVGMTFVLVVGGIDLSVGSLLALGSSVLAVLMVSLGWPLWLAIIGAVAAGAACGLISGSITAFGRIPSFIVTLGMLEIARGLAKIISDSQSIYIGSSVGWIGDAIGVIGISPAFVFAIAVVAVGQFVLARTVFGRYCIAIGTNEEAVRMSGINAKPYIISVFVISGMLCGVAGLMTTSLMSTANPNEAVGFELRAIAACVVGGTSLMGGRGSVVATFLGVLIIAVLESGLAQLSVEDPMKQVITGCVIVVAVLLDVARQKWSRS
jgi:ribose transport system permease protein